MKKNWIKKSGYIGALSLTLCGGVLASVAYSSTIVSADSIEQLNTIKEKIQEVSTAAEFEAALKDVTVTKVSLKADFSLERHISHIPARDLIIEGNGHQISFGNNHIEGATGAIATLTVNNLKASAKEVDAGYFFYAAHENWSMNVNDVKFQGKRFVEMPNGKLVFSGTNDISTTAENAWVRHVEFLEDSVYNSKAATGHSSFSAFYFNGHDINGTVNINKNAKVNIDLSPDGNNGYPVFFDRVSQINIKDGAVLDIKTPGKAFKFNSYSFEETATINVSNGSSLKVTSAGINSDPVIDYNDKGAKLEVSNNSDIDIKGSSKRLFTTNKGSVIDIKNSNYNFENHKTNSYIFDSKNTTFSLNEVSLNTWTKTGGDYERESDESYDKLNLQSILSGYESSLTSSTNPEAQNNFQMSNYGRISGDFEKQNNVETPIVNVINDKDTQLTGFGISGATVNVYKDGKLFGTTTVDGDGRWVLSLEAPLKEGVVVEASQVIEGEESKKVSQIVSHLSSETVNFFKYGYLQSYGLILEGSIDNGDLDLTNSTFVKKTLHIVDGNGEDILSSDLANHDWYNPGVFNGYQAILTNETLATLKDGEYKLKVTLSTGDFTETQDLNVSNARYVGHTVFDEIEALNTGTKTVKTINKKGIGYLKITNN